MQTFSYPFSFPIKNSARREKCDSEDLWISALDFWQQSWIKKWSLFLGLAFEHSGWQSEQSRTFAEIFSDAIRHGLPAIQTQHPGLYYQQVNKNVILNTSNDYIAGNCIVQTISFDPRSNH